MHVVEEYGRAIRPYGEWRYPYRPYSVPYQLWGPPFAGLGYYPFGPFGPPSAAGVGPGQPWPDMRQPWEDGAYPRDRVRPRMPYRPRHNERRPHDPRPQPPGPGPGPGPRPGPYGR
jgi:hypothetical protein